MMMMMQDWTDTEGTPANEDKEEEEEPDGQIIISTCFHSDGNYSQIHLWTGRMWMLEENCFYRCGKNEHRLMKLTRVLIL